MSALLRVSLRQLEYFVAVVELQTMGAAAVRWQVSPSAISLAIGELERALQVQLFLRQKAKPLQLTAAGRQVLADARPLLARAEELQANARGLGQALSGDLTVGCFPTLSPYVMPTALDVVAAAHPDVQIRFVEGSIAQLQAWLYDGTCEVAVMYDIGLEPNLDCTELYRVRPHVELPADHPLAARRRIRLEQLADEPMIMLDMPPGQEYFRSLFTDRGLTPRVVRSSISVDGVRGLVASGRGFTVLLQRPVFPFTYAGHEIAVREIADRLEPVAVQVAAVSWARATRRALAFRELCRANLREPARRTGIADPR
jgi:DNA-binding transcriptional LysR family regulator